MAPRPYVLLSCATSVDGYLDDTSDTRLLLSNAADFARIDDVRASCDAILVGANTIRKDNPRLLVRSREPGPLKVTLTASGALAPDARFFTTGEAAKVVYASSPVVAATQAAFSKVADVVDAGAPPNLNVVLRDLGARGIQRLMVEGGGATLTQFLTLGLADELQLAIAPFFVGDSTAPRFALDGEYPWNAGQRARLADVTQLGDVALLRYALSDRFTQ